MRLFLKIFLSFWFAVVFAAAVAVAMTISLGNRTVLARWRHLAVSAVGVYAQTSAEIYDRRGAAALDRYLVKVDSAASVKAYLFQGDTELSHLHAPFNALRLAKASERDSGLITLLRPSRAWVAVPVTGPSGRSYVLVTDLSGLLPSTQFPLLRIILVVLAAGLVCFLLARHLANPIIRIRGAALKLSSGDLSARVGSGIAVRGDEIGELARDFDVMAGRFEALVGSQKRILADISHELRSPLARLNVALGLARRSADPATLTSLDRIEREANRLDTLIGQLSTLTMLESGARVRQQTPVDMVALVEEIVADANYEAEANQRSVVLTGGQGDAGCIVLGDGELLRSALDNVVRNAVRYTAEGTAVEVSLSWLVDGKGRSASVRVKDHGPGIPEDMLKEIFRPFFRIGEARDRKSGGVGLGLAIAEQAVRLHGGRISARNVSEGGLVVEIVLPEK
jgi:two-component system sensor histidine kinase CpxA